MEIDLERVDGRIRIVVNHGGGFIVPCGFALSTPSSFLTEVG